MICLKILFNILNNKNIDLILFNRLLIVYRELNDWCIELVVNLSNGSNFILVAGKLKWFRGGEGSF